MLKAYIFLLRVEAFTEGKEEPSIIDIRKHFVLAEDEKEAHTLVHAFIDRTITSNKAVPVKVTDCTLVQAEEAKSGLVM